MVTDKGPGNKAPVDIFTHHQRQRRYSASNWANKAIHPIVLSYMPNSWDYILKMLINNCMRYALSLSNP